jgi:hypothetical protein
MRLRARLDRLMPRTSESLANSAEWIELRGRIVVALDPFPEAKAAVLAAIRERKS